MKIKNSGKIIIISSKSGLKGYSTGALYCAFKSAWITFHESISRELKHVKGLSILTICPDSFSNHDGSKRRGYTRIINKIMNKITSSLNDNNSELYFPSRLKTKISYILLFIKKLKITIK
jgi:short-subunit dehydrogenase